MSRIIDIEQRIEKMEKLKQEIERSKELINIALGEELMKGLELDYGEFTSKKEVTELAQKIQDNLSNDFFNNTEQELEEENKNSEIRHNQHNNEFQSN